MPKRKSQRSKVSRPAKRVKVEQVTSTAEMSDYEKTILENIRRNNEVLLELNISEAQHDLRNTAPKKKYTKLNWKKTRESLRIRRLEPDGVTALPERHVFNIAASRWDKPRHRGQLKMTLANDGVEEDSKALLSTLDDLMSTTRQSKSSLKLNSDCVSYKKQMEQLKVKEDHVTKVVPERISSVTIHGMRTKTLVFAGDKRGHLGIWDVDSKEENNVFVYEPHTGAIVTMAINPDDTNKLLTCSYDGTIRCADFGKTVFNEVCAVDRDDTYFTYMAFGTTSCHTLLASSGDGQVHIVDCRESNDNYPHYQLHDRTIKCLDVHPQNRNIFVTSTNKGTISLWDVRKLKGPSSSTSSLPAHSRSVSSVFFSPLTGTQLLSTSLNNCITVYDVNDSGVTTATPTCTFRHDNKTGRWLSTFHATWDPKTDTCFAIGSMKKFPRQVDIYSSDYKAGALTHLQHDNFTTITSRIAFHPSRNMMTGANSSGKVFLWSTC